MMEVAHVAEAGMAEAATVATEADIVVIAAKAAVIGIAIGGPVANTVVTVAIGRPVAVATRIDRTVNGPVVGITTAVRGDTRTQGAKGEHGSNEEEFSFHNLNLLVTEFDAAPTALFKKINASGCRAF